MTVRSLAQIPRQHLPPAFCLKQAAASAIASAAYGRALTAWLRRLGTVHWSAGPRRNANGSATASGSASMGALHAYCRTAQEIAPFSVSYVQTDSNGDTQQTTEINPLVAGGSASVDVSAQDAVNVIGTLPPGTLVRVRLGLVVDSALSLSGGRIFGDGDSASLLPGSKRAPELRYGCAGLR